ncbi:hypothetical protein BDP27DRAFT_1225905, partial [Rhodocollybia butyracea]
LQVYFPKLHLFLTNLQEKVLMDSPDIRRMFEGCCYTACHLNLHLAWAQLHEDFFNVFFAMCAVHASGKFDHTRGGQFIAWSLGVVVPFPAGATIYVPSACVTHGNVPIAPEETRSSIAFFTPAGIARWFHNGYMSDKEFKERASPRQLRLWKEYREKLWETGLELLQEG